jgi:hypothetical protein
MVAVPPWSAGSGVLHREIEAAGGADPTALPGSRAGTALELAERTVFTDVVRLQNWCRWARSRRPNASSMAGLFVALAAGGSG